MASSIDDLLLQIDTIEARLAPAPPDTSVDDMLGILDTIEARQPVPAKPTGPAPFPETVFNPPQTEPTVAASALRAVPRGAVETAAVGLEPLALSRRRAQTQAKTLTTGTRDAGAFTNEDFQVFLQSVAKDRNIPLSLKSEIINTAKDVRAGKIEADAIPDFAARLEGNLPADAIKWMRDFAASAFPIPKEHEGRLSVQVGSGVGSTLTFLLTRLLPGGQLLLPVVAGSMGAGEAIQRAARVGADDEEQAKAGLMGVVPGLTDILPIENLLRPIARNPGVKGALYAIARKAIEQGAIEGTQEAVQGFLQNAIERITTAPGQSLTEGIARDGLVGFLVGTLFGGGFTGLSMTTEPIKRSTPPGEIENAATEAAIRAQSPSQDNLTPADKASPITNPTISKGKALVENALAGNEATGRASEILQRNNLPGIDSRVTVTLPDGTAAAGTVIDAFTETNAELGLEEDGIKIALDDGTKFEEFIADLAERGIAIAPETAAPQERPLADLLAEKVPAAEEGAVDDTQGRVDVRGQVEQGQETGVVPQPEGGAEAVGAGRDVQGDVEAPGVAERVATPAIDAILAQTRQEAPTPAAQAAPQAQEPVSGTQVAPEAETAPVAASVGQEAAQKPFDPTPYLSRGRAYIAERGRPLTPEAIGKRLGIEPDQANRVLGMIVSAPGSGLRMGRNGKLRRVAIRKGPVDALTFLAERGGIRDDGGHDLERGRGLQRLIPGAGMLIRKNGMSIDEAGEVLLEAGYFGPAETVDRPTEAEVLELLDRAAFEPVYRAEDQADVDDQAAENENAYRIDQAIDEIGANLTDAERAAVIKAMAEGESVDDAIERVAIQSEAETAEKIVESRPEIEDIPFEVSRDEDTQQRARRNGDVAPQEQPAQEHPAAVAEGGPARGEERGRAGAVQGEASIKVKRTVARLRKVADSLQNQIDDKRNSGVSQQRPTARRSRMAASMRADGDRLASIQTKMRALADGHEQGTVPAVLNQIVNKAQIETLIGFREFPTADWAKADHQRMARAGITAANYQEARNALDKLGTFELSKEEQRERSQQELRAKVASIKIPGFFETPEDIAKRMVKMADIEPGMSVLEPSAGAGAIARQVRDDAPKAELTVNERSTTLAELLRTQGFQPLTNDFLEMSGKWDRILMNPPFEKGQDVEHVRHAYELLKPGGRVISIMGEHAFFASDKKSVGFREWLANKRGSEQREQLPSGTFEQTTVSARLVMIEKPTDSREGQGTPKAEAALQDLIAEMAKDPVFEAYVRDSKLEAVEPAAKPTTELTARTSSDKLLNVLARFLRNELSFETQRAGDKTDLIVDGETLASVTGAVDQNKAIRALGENLRDALRAEGRQLNNDIQQMTLDEFTVAYGLRGIIPEFEIDIGDIGSVVKTDESGKFVVDIRELFNRIKKPTTESTEAGEQTVLPGTEQVTKQEARARKKADDAAKLREIKERETKLRRGGQESIKDQEGGLFDAALDQGDIEKPASEFPDASHRALFEYGRRLSEGGRVETDTRKTLWERFNGFVEDQTEDDIAPFAKPADVDALARDYFEETTDSGKPGSVISPDEAARYAIKNKDFEPKYSLGPVNPKFAGDLPRISTNLRARMKKLGIADKVALRLVDDLRAMIGGKAVLARGRFTAPRTNDPVWLDTIAMIEVSLAVQKDAPWVLNHEIIHALRELRLLRDAEWRVLTKAAKADTERMDRMRDQRKGQGLTEDQITEEVIADMFADWSVGRTQAGGFLKRAFERIRDFLTALGRTLTQRGYTSMNDIFKAVESGEVGRRDSDTGPMGMSQEFMDASESGKLTVGAAQLSPITDVPKDAVAIADAIREAVPGVQVTVDHSATSFGKSSYIKIDNGRIELRISDHGIGGARFNRERQLGVIFLRPGENPTKIVNDIISNVAVAKNLNEHLAELRRRPDDELIPLVGNFIKDARDLAAQRAHGVAWSELSKTKQRHLQGNAVRLAAEMKETRIGQYVGSIAPKLSLGRPLSSAATFENPETESRWQEARKGAASQDTLAQRVGARVRQFGQGFARHYIHLPNIAKFAEVSQEFRKFEAAPKASMEQVVRILRDITNGMTRNDLDLFTRKTVLDDLQWEVVQDHELPFAMTPADVSLELAKIDRILATRPDLLAKLRQRKLVARGVANRLVEAGVLHREQIKNPAYYRHQVLDYAMATVAEAKRPRSERAGGAIHSPKWAKRLGSSKDINANFLEAEYEWLYKALTGIAEAKLIESVKNSEHNTRDFTVLAARESNAASVRAALAKDMDANAYFVREDKETGEQIMSSPLNDEWKGFKQRIAIGLSKIRKALEDGAIDNIPKEFGNAAASLAEPKDSTMEFDEGSIFPFLAWMIDNDKTGAESALMVFKAISQRKKWTKDLLGKKHVETTDMETLVKRGFAPEGAVAWQADKGNLLFVSKTIPEHVMDRMLARLEDMPVEGGMISTDDVKAAMASVRPMLAVGGPKYQMILPAEVADTLNSIRDPHAESLILAMIQWPTRQWKRWVLINPRRVLKYNINNFSGDLDAVIAGNPRALRQLPRAIKELYAVTIKGGSPSERFREAAEYGVIDSGWSVQEVPDINALSQFKRLIDGPTIKRPDRLGLSGITAIWRGLQKYTWFRENWLRYAAYLDYVERLDASESMSSIGYGAAKREMVDGIRDPKMKAAYLSRELVGDYGAISAAGGEIRATIIPFYSWMEINTKRYWRLEINAWSQGVGEGLKTTARAAPGLAIRGAALGIKTTVWLHIRAALLYGMVQLWNNLMFGDEEDELRVEDRVRLHLNLGRNANGEVRLLRFQGALSDYLGWIGFENAATAISEVERGRGSWGDVLTQIAKAPLNRVINGLTPLITMPLELSDGFARWPDVTRPRPIKDKWRYVAKLFSVENEYDFVMNKPSRGFVRSIGESVISRRDIGETAYGRIKSMAFEFMRRERGSSGQSSYNTERSRALYTWRLAKKFGDKSAARKARQHLREIGVTGKDLGRSIKRAHPLGGIPIKRRAGFLKSLTARERESLTLANRWYRETYLQSPATRQ